MRRNSNVKDGRMSGNKEPDVIEKMQEAWFNEKCSPELLPYESELVSTLLAKIDTQYTRYINNQGEDNDQFISNLYEMEAERAKYALRCYLRTRITKIEKYFMHILKTEDMYIRLSEQELEYAEKYCTLVQGHLEKTVLNQLPENDELRKLDDQKTHDMISKPNLNEFTFCQVLQDIGDYQLNEVDAVFLQKDEIYILNYKIIKPLLEEGKIRLL